MLNDLWIGFLLSFGVAFLAYLKRSLTWDGFLAATLLGTTIYTFGGMTIWGSLIAFFISSSLLTKIHEKKEKEHSKGRNYVQVLSNGLVATVFSVVYFFLQHEILMLAAVVSIASSNSDTWASEIGALSKGKTMNIINFKSVPKGVSGAISGLGTLSSFLGALFIAVIFIGIYALNKTITIPNMIEYAFIITLCGFLGSLIDSLLGASLQAQFKGIKSGKITEKSWLPNEKVVLSSGLIYITNDAVNFISSLAASLFTLIFFI